MDLWIYSSKEPFRAEDPVVAPDVGSLLAVQEFTSSKTKDTQMTDANLSLAATPAYTTG